jgi:hypothetical protein
MGTPSPLAEKTAEPRTNEILSWQQIAGETRTSPYPPCRPLGAPRCNPRIGCSLKYRKPGEQRAYVMTADRRCWFMIVRRQVPGMLPSLWGPSWMRRAQKSPTSAEQATSSMRASVKGCCA